MAVLQTPLSAELRVLWDVAWGKRGLPCLGTKARGKQPVLFTCTTPVTTSHGGGIIRYLFMHHPVWCNAQALG